MIGSNAQWTWCSSLSPSPTAPLSLSSELDSHTAPTWGLCGLRKENPSESTYLSLEALSGQTLRPAVYLAQASSSSYLPCKYRALPSPFNSKASFFCSPPARWVAGSDPKPPIGPRRCNQQSECDPQLENNNKMKRLQKYWVGLLLIDWPVQDPHHRLHLTLLSLQLLFFCLWYMCQMLDFLLKKFSNLNHPEFFEILLSLQLGVLLHGEAASGELARIQASFSWQREHCAMGSPSQSRFLRKEIEIRLRAVGNSSLTKHILHTCIENRNKRRRDIEFGELSSVEQNQKIWARRALWSWWVSISCCTVQKHSKSEQRKTPGPLRAQCALCRGGG